MGLRGGANAYRYAANSPVMAVDTSGQVPQWVWETAGSALQSIADGAAFLAENLNRVEGAARITQGAGYAGSAANTQVILAGTEVVSAGTATPAVLAGETIVGSLALRAADLIGTGAYQVITNQPAETGLHQAATASGLTPLQATAFETGVDTGLDAATLVDANPGTTRLAVSGRRAAVLATNNPVRLKAGLETGAAVLGQIAALMTGDPGDGGSKLTGERLIIGAHNGPRGRFAPRVEPGDLTVDRATRVDADFKANISNPLSSDLQALAGTIREVVFERLPGGSMGPMENMQTYQNALELLQPGGRVEIVSGPMQIDKELTMDMLRQVGFEDVKVSEFKFDDLDMLSITGMKSNP